MIRATLAQLGAKRAMRTIGVSKTMPKLLKASDYSFTNRDRGDVEKCVSLGIRIARKATIQNKKVYYIYIMWEWFVFLAFDESEVVDRVEIALNGDKIVGHSLDEG
jgi:hypothetical protein